MAKIALVHVLRTAGGGLAMASWDEGGTGQNIELPKSIEEINLRAAATSAQQATPTELNYKAAPAG